MAETKRHTNPAAEAFLFEPIKVLDKGSLELVDYMGIDETVVGAARVSYGKEMNLADSAGNQKLINFLMKNRHTSPFEQIILTFKCKMPIFVAREWVRHRTARLNEFSGRYAQLANEIYTPSTNRILGQDLVNKQGSAGEIDSVTKEQFLLRHMLVTNEAYTAYEASLKDGIAKELARIDLPLSTYTKWIWQCDMHNLLHFLGLRAATSAQWEIRQYALKISEIVSTAYPMIWKAYSKYVQNCTSLTRDEVLALRSFISGIDMSGDDGTWESIKSKIMVDL